MTRPVIVIGSGGHAKVVIEALRQSGIPVLGRTDADPGKANATLSGVPFLGNDDALQDHDPAQVMLANGVGSTGNAAARITVFERCRERGFRFVRVIHPTAIIAGDVEVGEGTQIMAGAIIQPGCHIGNNVVINTGARVDHDCDIGDHVHVAPGAVLCGEVTVGARSHVGAGAVVIQGMTVGDGCLIAAGAAVTRPVANGARVAGVPARTLVP